MSFRRTMNTDQRRFCEECLAGILAVSIWYGVLYLLGLPAGGPSGIMGMIGSGVVLAMCLSFAPRFAAILIHFLVPPAFPGEDSANPVRQATRVETRRVSALFHRQRPSTRARVMREP